MNIFCFKLALAIFLLKNSKLITGQLTPQERCDAVPTGITTNICNSCTESYPCTGGTPSGYLNTADPVCTVTAPPSEICDFTALDGSYDGDCITFPNVAFSSICSCSEVRCFPDPNNPELFYNCEIVGTIGTRKNPTECVGATPIFDQATCECVAVDPDDCPSCGMIQAFESECTTSFVVCASNAIIPCPKDTCFDSKICSCQPKGGSPTSTCSDTCDKYPDPDDTTGKQYCICVNDPDDLNDGDPCEVPCGDGEIFDADECDCVVEPIIIACPQCQKKQDPANSPSGYCVCQEGAEDVCFECPEGEIFYPDSNICNCAPDSTVLTPEPNSECQPCGIQADPNGDCASYYACDTATGEITTGPYTCPGNTCFNPEGCNCA